MQPTHTCRSEKEMIEWAADIGCRLSGGEVFALVGDLGCGKTTFVKGLAIGLNILSVVTSPTFNLVHRYQGGKFPLIHFDLYRLKKFEEIEALDLETALDGKNVIAIEWPQLARPVLPPRQTRWIEFREVNDSERTVLISSQAADAAVFQSSFRNPPKATPGP